MEISQTYSYRHAEAIILTEYPTYRQDILDVVASINWVRLPEARPRIRKGKEYGPFGINQNETNKEFERHFVERGWKVRPRIVSKAPSQLAADFKKDVIQVEVQFGNMARWYTDVFKFLLSYAANDIEIGVLIVPMQHVSKQIDENVVYFERVTRELPHAKMAITIPVWVIGLGE